MDRGRGTLQAERKVEMAGTKVPFAWVFGTGEIRLENFDSRVERLATTYTSS